MTSTFPLLEIDCEAEASRIAESLRALLCNVFRRKGFVVAMSGGVDSSICAALAVRAVGPERVCALFMPERDSSNDSRYCAEAAARSLGIRLITESIEPVLIALRCHSRRDDAIRTVVPEFEVGWRCKLVLIGQGRATGGVNISGIVVESPTREQYRRRLTANAYRGIVAASNFKQRVRTMLAYYHADLLHYAVIGTPNRLEYDQGFFVKGGDGLADVKPIAHLYKSQVYQLAEYLELPRDIVIREPTTDTFSLPQSQDEFYFSFPWRTMDELLACHEHGLCANDAAELIDIPLQHVSWAYEDIERKRSVARYLHLGAQLLADTDRAPEPRA